jgi:hypothetical protein
MCWTEPTPEGMVGGCTCWLPSQILDGGGRYLSAEGSSIKFLPASAGPARVESSAQGSTLVAMRLAPTRQGYRERATVNRGANPTVRTHRSAKRLLAFAIHGVRCGRTLMAQPSVPEKSVPPYESTSPRVTRRAYQRCTSAPGRSLDARPPRGRYVQLLDGSG